MHCKEISFAVIMRHSELIAYFWNRTAKITWSAFVVRESTKFSDKKWQFMEYYNCTSDHLIKYFWKSNRNQLYGWQCIVSQAIIANKAKAYGWDARDSKWRTNNSKISVETLDIFSSSFFVNTRTWISFENNVRKQGAMRPSHLADSSY